MDLKCFLTGEKQEMKKRRFIKKGNSERNLRVFYIFMKMALKLSFRSKSQIKNSRSKVL